MEWEKNSWEDKKGITNLNSG